MVLLSRRVPLSVDLFTNSKRGNVYLKRAVSNAAACYYIEHQYKDALAAIINCIRKNTYIPLSESSAQCPESVNYIL